MVSGSVRVIDVTGAGVTVVAAVAAAVAVAVTAVPRGVGVALARVSVNPPDCAIAFDVRSSANATVTEVAAISTITLDASSICS